MGNREQPQHRPHLWVGSDRPEVFERSRSAFEWTAESQATSTPSVGSGDEGAEPPPGRGRSFGTCGRTPDRRRGLRSWWRERTASQRAIVLVAAVVTMVTLVGLTGATASSSAATSWAPATSPARTCASAVLGPITDTVEQVGTTDDPYGVPRYIKQEGDQLDSTYGQGSVETVAYTAAMSDLISYLYQQEEQHDVVSNAEAGRLNQIAEQTCRQYAGRVLRR